MFHHSVFIIFCFVLTSLRVSRLKAHHVSRTRSADGDIGKNSPALPNPFARPKHPFFPLGHHGSTDIIIFRATTTTTLLQTTIIVYKEGYLPRANLTG